MTKKITQDALHELTGISREYISKIENGKASISVEILLKIADGLSVQPSELIDGLKN